MEASTHVGAENVTCLHDPNALRRTYALDCRVMDATGSGSTKRSRKINKQEPGAAARLMNNRLLN